MAQNVNPTSGPSTSAAASADIKAAEEFPEKLKKIIDGKILCKTNRKNEFCSVFTK